jgi:hypothetical protein
VRAGGKVLIAPATASALRNNHAFIRMREVVQALAGFIVINNGPDRDFQDNALAVAASAVGAFTVAPTLTFIFRIEAEMDQRVVPFAGLHNDVATTAAVAARRASARYKLLPAKGHAAVPTVAALNPDDRFVNKHAVLLIVQAAARIRCQGNPTQIGTQIVRDNRLLLQLAHGCKPSVHLFFAHNLFLCGNVPVVPGAIADAGRSIAIELIGRLYQ